MSNLEAEYRELTEEIVIGATADGCTHHEEFFRIFSNLSAECGDSPDLEYAPIANEGYGFKLDGYALEIPDDVEGSSGDLYLATSSFFASKEIPSLVSKDIDKIVIGVQRFLSVAMSSRSETLEEASHAYQLAMLIQNYLHKISRIRILIFTNAQLKTRRKILEGGLIGDIPLGINVLDIERYSKIVTSGNDPVEIDLEEEYGGALGCILASNQDAPYKSYLLAIPGEILASIFAKFGNRLLEQNVRTYLQNKTNVNKGILKTIEHEPEMFFAYNNGLTATSSRVETSHTEENGLRVSKISDFQIVNGGQTTASLLYARDGIRTKKLSLNKVLVQCKLSEVPSERMGTVVPKISEFANTQNKVSLSDLASNSSAQIKIEQLSKDISTPTRIGALHSTKWFYERAKGQYRNLTAYRSTAEKKRLDVEYPKNQLITKTDLAKYEYSYDQLPHIVCLGAQKCFTHFTQYVVSKVAIESLTEVWYKRAVAKAIIFLSLDNLISYSDWYRENRGLKAQTVAFTISECSYQFGERGFQIDLSRIWREQEIGVALKDYMLATAQQVQRILLNPPPNDANSAMFARKAYCWEMHVRGKTRPPSTKLLEYGIKLDDLVELQLENRKSVKLDTDLHFEIQLAKLIPRAAEIKDKATNKKLLSPANESALNKLRLANINLTKKEINALKSLLPRLGIEIL